MNWTTLRKYRTPLTIFAALLLALVLIIDDWGRDFTTNVARIESASSDPALKPYGSHLTTDELVEALKWASRRIGGWQYVGDASEGATTALVFVRTSRVFRLKSDITLRIEDRGSRRVVTGESRSRIGMGDLGQNPRNLRRLLQELQAVIAGAQRGTLT